MLNGDGVWHKVDHGGEDKGRIEVDEERRHFFQRMEHQTVSPRGYAKRQRAVCGAVAAAQLRERAKKAGLRISTVMLAQNREREEQAGGGIEAYTVKRNSELGNTQMNNKLATLRKADESRTKAW